MGSISGSVLEVFFSLFEVIGAVIFMFVVVEGILFGFLYFWTAYNSHWMGKVLLIFSAGMHGLHLLEWIFGSGGMLYDLEGEEEEEEEVEEGSSMSNILSMLSWAWFVIMCLFLLLVWYL